MIFIEKKEKTQWIMTAIEAKLLGQELMYIAEEANDHQIDQMSQMIVEGNVNSVKFKKIKEFRIIIKPDKKERRKNETRITGQIN